MSGVTIRTSGRHYPLLRWDELTAKEQAEFGWLGTDDKRAFAEFVRYKRWVYSLDQFSTTLHDGPFSGWHGYHSDGAFSGVLLRLVGDGTDFVQMGVTRP